MKTRVWLDIWRMSQVIPNSFMPKAWMMGAQRSPIKETVSTTAEPRMLFAQGDIITRAMEVNLLPQHPFVIILLCFVEMGRSVDVLRHHRPVS